MKDTNGRFREIFELTRKDRKWPDPEMADRPVSLVCRTRSRYHSGIATPEHPGSVVVLPVLPDGRIVLIRQYRHATRQYLWELVAGRIDAGESPKKAAARELIEETGYRAKKFTVFLDVFPTPGFLEERMYLLLAEGVTAGQAQPEEDEKIVVAAYTRKQLEQMIRTGKLKDAKSIAGLLFYFSFLIKKVTSR